MFSDFPNLHPLVVHLPIVLLLLSAALQALLVYKDWPPVKWITMGVMAGGFLGALAASTVFHALPAGLAPRAAAVFAAHEQFASYTLWLSGITLLLAGIGKYFQIERRAYEVLVLVSAVATAGVLSVAGHRGAQLVYVEGVGPQGRLLDKSHGHGGGEAMPGMDMEADGHKEEEGADDHHPDEAPAAAGPQATTKKPASQEMQGMDMDGKATPKQRRNAARGQMAGMDMANTPPARSARPASRAAAMPDMPGMKMPASKSPQSMPKGMDMSRSAKPKQMQEMPGMENMSGMNKPAAGPKKPAKGKSEMEGMSGMGNMADMPGMESPNPKQPSQNKPPMGNMNDMPGMKKGQAMPAMGTMPGMSMPASPMDKFRFEDNNPARNKPKPAKQ